MALERVATVNDIPDDEGRGFPVAGRRVAVFRVGDRFFAMDDVCSHAHAYLSEGEIDEDDLTVECPRHGSMFELETGKPRALPATLPVRTYPVKVEGDDILIEVNEE